MSVIDRLYIERFITHQAMWCKGHGAIPDSHVMGFGMMYYGLVHAMHAELCVVLGSGGGFVPRIVWQAQLDLRIPDARTILVDGNMGEWGRPDWTDPESFFRQNWPSVIWWQCSTEEAIVKLHESEEQIDFLHIDADHSQAKANFLDYKDLVRIGGVVTIHDTLTNGACDARQAMEDIREMEDWDVIDFSIGAGIALARRNS